MDFTAVTSRDDFLLSLGEALGGQAAIRPVDSIAGALEYLMSRKRGQVLVIDTRDISYVRGDVEFIHGQAPHAVVLMFSLAEHEKEITAAVRGSDVLAVLPIPVDNHKTSIVLDTAITDALARKSKMDAIADWVTDEADLLISISQYFKLSLDEAAKISIRLTAFIVDALKEDQRLVLRDKHGKDQEVTIERDASETNEERGRDGE